MRQRSLGKKIAAWLMCLAMVVTTVNMPAFTTSVKAEGEVLEKSDITFTVVDANPEGYEREKCTNIVDGNIDTKWCCQLSEGTTYYAVIKASKAFAVSSYKITIANDTWQNPWRNPKSWKLYGCNDYNEETNEGTWVMLDDISDGALPTSAKQAKTFDISNSVAYQYYKWEISSIVSSTNPTMQVSEFSLICNHSFSVTEVVDATCTKTGYDVKKCSECNEIVRVANDKVAKGHDFVKKDTVAASCIVDGYDIEKCSRCEETRAVVNGDIAKGHNFVNGVCTICNDKRVLNQYLSKADLDASDFNDNYNLCGGTQLKVYFGKTSAGDEQPWYLAGKNEDDQSLVFLCSPYAPLNSMPLLAKDNSYIQTPDGNIYTQDEFDESGLWETSSYSSFNNEKYAGKTVYANHYGASDARKYLVELTNGTTNEHFSAEEQRLMVNSHIVTEDTYNKSTYELYDKLYLIACGNTFRYGYMGNSIDNKPASGLTLDYDIDSPYKASKGDNLRVIDFPYRTPYDSVYGETFLFSFDGSSALRTSRLVPAFHMNLESVLFASPAKPAMNKAAFDGTGMYIRYDSTKDATGKKVIDRIKSTATVHTNGITVHKGYANDEYLYVQWNDGKEDKLFSKKIDADLSLSAECIGATDFSSCRIWIEKEDLKANLIYAKILIASNEAGTYEGHVYDQKVESEKAKLAKANCQDNQSYYMSCACGAVSNDADQTFTVENTSEAHDFTDAEGNPSELCKKCGAEKSVAHGDTNHFYIYTYKDNSTHIKKCANCEDMEEQAHSFNNGKCVCGLSENTNQSDYAYVEKNDLGKVFGLTDADKPVVKLKYGKRFYDSSDINWLIVGQEKVDGDETLVLLADGACDYGGFGVYYGYYNRNVNIFSESNLYHAMNDDCVSDTTLTSANVNNLFTVREKSYIKPVTVQQTYPITEYGEEKIVTDSAKCWIYVPDGKGEGNTHISLGSRNNFSVSIQDWKKYKGDGNYGYWLRSAATDERVYAISLANGYRYNVTTAGVNQGSFGAGVLPAMNLKLSDILFASKATGASANATLEDSLTLRFNGAGSIKSTATADKYGIGVKKNENENIYLYVQDNAGKWVYSKKITETGCVPVEEILADSRLQEAGVTELDLSKCQIWIEKSTDKVSYAKKVSVADEHDYSAYTSVDDTTHTKACANCGLASTDEVDKESHVLSYRDEEDGEHHILTCEICDYAIQGNHDFSKQPYQIDDAGKHYQICANCTAETEHEACTAGKATCTTKATLTTNGKIETKCSVCGDVSSTKIIYAAKTVKLDKVAYTYDGKTKKPSVVIKDSKGKEVPTSNYTVTYPTASKKVGEYTVKITFKGNYKGSKKLTFKINPVKTAISSLTAGSKSFTVKWAKKTAEVTGYQLQYSTSDKFKTGNKTVTITKNGIVKKQIKSLKAGKKYYVRMRTYKTVGKVKFYSEWSAKKAVTTKK